MEQRRLRLGDILDDYCPRERRVTNHAIVAMIEDDVKQTRCTTCDAEHVYKGGQSPRKRRKDAGTALYQEVLAGMPETSEVSSSRPAAPAPVAVTPPVVETAADTDPALATDEPAAAAPATPDPDDEAGLGDERQSDGQGGDDGPIHRRLIRATLPRPEGQKEVRQVTDFTIRANGNRPGGGFRGDRLRGQGASGGGSGSGMRTGGRRFGGGNQPGAGGARNGSGRNRPGFGGGGHDRGPAGNTGRPQGGRKRSR